MRVLAGDEFAVAEVGRETAFDSFDAAGGFDQMLADVPGAVRADPGFDLDLVHRPPAGIELAGGCDVVLDAVGATGEVSSVLAEAEHVVVPGLGGVDAEAEAGGVGELAVLLLVVAKGAG